MNFIDVPHDVKVLSDRIIPGQIFALPYSFRYRGQYNDYFEGYFNTYRDLRKKPSVHKHLRPIFDRWKEVKVPRRDNMILFNTFNRDSRNSFTFKKPLAIRRDQFSFRIWLDTYISHVCDFNYFHNRNVIGISDDVWQLLLRVDGQVLRKRDKNGHLLIPRANFYPFVLEM